jgi:hypothetical protein
MPVNTEQELLLQQIAVQLGPYAVSPYMAATIKIEHDELDLIRDKIIPFINIKLRNFKIGAADNLDLAYYKRHSYEIVLTFATAAIARADVVISSSNTGIWSLCNNIIAGLKSDLSFKGLCSTAPFRADTAVDCMYHQDGKKWIGRGVLKTTLYKDIFYR